MLGERPVAGEHQHHRVAGVVASCHHRVVGVVASCPVAGVVEHQHHRVAGVEASCQHRVVGVEASCHLQLADLPRRRSAWLGTNC